MCVKEVTKLVDKHNNIEAECTVINHDTLKSKGVYDII